MVIHRGRGLDRGRGLGRVYGNVGWAKRKARGERAPAERDRLHLLHKRCRSRDRRRATDQIRDAPVCSSRVTVVRNGLLAHLFVVAEQVRARDVTQGVADMSGVCAKVEP